MIEYAKYFGSNKTMFFKINDKKLLKNYTEIWKKISNLINTNFDSEPIYGDNDGDNDKYIKTKIKSYGVKKKIFQGNKTENASCKYLSLIKLDYLQKL